MAWIRQLFTRGLLHEVRLYCLYTGLKSVTLTYVTLIPTYLSGAAYMCPFRTLSYEGAFDIGKLGTFVISGGTTNSYRSRTVYRWGGGTHFTISSCTARNKEQQRIPLLSAAVRDLVHSRMCFH